MTDQLMIYDEGNLEMGEREARELTASIRQVGDSMWELVQTAYRGRAWAVLGYETWDAYCAGEFAGARLALPREDRQEVVQSLRESGMSQRAIAAATGAGRATVHRDLAGAPNGAGGQIVGLDGKQYQPVASVAHVAHNSGVNEWYTPAQYIEAARDTLGRIDLDPASSAIANETVQAETFYTETDDGLSQHWHGKVWMNPPYAQPLIGEFVAKLIVAYGSSEVTGAVVLVNNGTETKWGQNLLSVASAACFPASRIRFVDPGGKPSAPLQGQMICYLGHEPGRFEDCFEQFGACL
jgi:ParB family chromosome partitioning protein